MRGCGIEGLSFRGVRCNADDPGHARRRGSGVLHRRPFAGCPEAVSLMPGRWYWTPRGEPALSSLTGIGIVIRMVRTYDGQPYRLMERQSADDGRGNRHACHHRSFCIGRRSIGAGTALGYSDLHNSNKILFWKSSDSGRHGVRVLCSIGPRQFLGWTGIDEQLCRSFPSACIPPQGLCADWINAECRRSSSLRCQRLSLPLNCFWDCGSYFCPEAERLCLLECLGYSSRSTTLDNHDWHSAGMKTASLAM